MYLQGIITGQEENKEMLQHVDALPSKVHVGIVYTHITCTTCYT